jgi:cytochrome c oxidase assembly protein subunit 15
MGWAMVKSGLVDVPRPSPWRLALHLLLAFALFGLLFHELLPAIAKPRLARSFLLALVTIGVASGAAMAGTRAGFLYPTFPTMGGHWVPPGLYPEGARSIAEDAISAHFDHRLLALIVTIAAILAAFQAESASRLRARILLAAVSLQVALGAATVLLHVPIALAVLHQLGGLAVFAAAVSLAGARVGDRQ